MRAHPILMSIACALAFFTARAAAQESSPARAAHGGPIAHRSALGTARSATRITPIAGDLGLARTCDLGLNGWVGNPAKAIVLLALPVAGIAALLSEQKGRAASGAAVAGSAYAVGATVVRSRQSRCTSTDGLIYLWTLPAAAAGAFIATR